MRSPTLGACVALALTVGACAGTDTGQTLAAPTAQVSPSTATALATASPATPTGSAALQTFASDIYAYTMSYPAGWSARGALRQLGDAEMPLDKPTADDRFTREPAKDPYPLVVVAAQAVPHGFSLERWGAFTVKVGAPHIGCQPKRQEATKFGGEPAVLFTYECGGGFVLWSALVRGDLGYDIVLGSLPGDEEATDRAVLDRLLATLAFTK